MNKVIFYTLHPRKLLLSLCAHGCCPFISDATYLKMKYKDRLGKELDLDDPKTFNEKLQWLKLHDHNPRYTVMADKAAVKKYVAAIIGEEHIIPTLGLWDRFDDIDFNSLPDQFVLKCTHDSGSIVVCRDKSKFDVAASRKKLNKALKQNYYWQGREWPYKNVHPRIIAEQYMEDESNKELKDYKIFNFNGKAKLIEVDYNRFVNHMRNIYTPEWAYVEAEINYPSDPLHIIPKPECLNEMLVAAEKISSGIPHVRTDFYSIEGRFYFGEITFFHDGDIGKFCPESLEKELGEWITLPGGGVLLRRNYYDLWVHQAQINGLTDYKFFCFGGKPEFLYVSAGLEDHASARISFVDLKWNQAKFERKDYKKFDALPPKPRNFDLMINIANLISKGIPFVRVDFYEINNLLYFSEFTFFPCGGMMPFCNDEDDIIIGKLLNLKNSGD